MTFSTLFVLLALCGTLAHAQTLCTTSTPGSEASCYTQRTTCRYTWLTTQCLVGAPATCAEFHRDTTGCLATSGCAVNSNNGHCFSVVPACPSLTQSQCGNRSDCRYTTTCQTGATPGTCGARTTGETCSTAGCFWDPFVGTGQCFATLQEVNSLYTCPFWSAYPAPTTSYACTVHGCLSQGQVCLADAGQPGNLDDGYSASTFIRYTALQPTLDANAFLFSTQLLFNLADFYKPTAPVYHSVVVGVPRASDTSPGICNSVLSQNSVIAASNYVDQPGLYAHFLSRVQTSSDLTFTGGDEKDPFVNAIIGRWKVGASALIRRVDIPAGLLTIAPTLTFDLNWCVDNCGCTRVVTPAYTQYNVPFGVVARSGNTNIAASSQNFTATFYTYGTVQVSGNSNNPLRAFVLPVTDSPNGCPAGQQRRLFTVRALFTNAFDGGRVVGIRTLADVSMVAVGQSQVVGGPTNCFGAAPFDVIPPMVCVNNECETMIRFRTRCTPVLADGDSLNKCSAQPAATRQADMGADVPYPILLDAYHGFFLYPKSWSGAGPSTPVGRDPTGLTPDQVVITINQPTFPLVDTNLTFTVQAGLLPFADAPFADRLKLADTATGQSDVDLRNAQLYFSRTLTLAVWLPTLDQRQTYQLHMDLPTIRFYALSSTGQQLGSTFLTWADIDQVSVRSPKRALADCPLCVVPLAARSGLVGIDAFSVPVSVLRVLLPANGYRIELSWQVTLPSPVTGRRLLQTGAEGNTTLVVMLDETETPFERLLTVDLGDSTQSAGESIGIAVGAIGGSALLGGLVAWKSAFAVLI